MMPAVEEIETPESKRSCFARISCSTVKSFVIKYFLPLGFGLALLTGLACPTPGAWLNGLKLGSFKAVQPGNMMLTFVISGLNLKTSEVAAAIKALVAFSYGLASILFITPFAGLVVAQVKAIILQWGIPCSLTLALPFL